MASYAESLLAPGEVVVLRSHQHPLSLVLDSRYGLLAWAAAIVSALVFLFIAGGSGLVHDVSLWVF